jgi:hypothetical protein
MGLRMGATLGGWKLVRPPGRSRRSAISGRSPNNKQRGSIVNNDWLEFTPRLTRREALGAMLATTGATALAAESQRTSGLGLVIYDCAIRRKWLQQRDPKFDLFEPLTFLKHCREAGAGGMQASLGFLEAARVTALRNFADDHKLFIDGIVNPPQDEAELSRFEAEIRTVAEVGVQAVRTVVMPGRRYEQFTSLAELREAEAKAVKMLELAAPIVTKHRVRLAVENHKDRGTLSACQRLSAGHQHASRCPPQPSVCRCSANEIERRTNALPASTRSQS